MEHFIWYGECIKNLTAKFKLSMRMYSSEDAMVRISQCLKNHFVMFIMFVQAC